MSSGQIDAPVSDSGSQNLWQIEIQPDAGQCDHQAKQVLAALRDLQRNDELTVRSAHGYFIEGQLDRDQAESLTRHLLLDSVTESVTVDRAGAEILNHLDGAEHCFYVLLKPGVTDAVALTAARAMQDSGESVSAVRTYRKYWISGASTATLEVLQRRILANASIEEIVAIPLGLKTLHSGSPYQFQLQTIPLRQADDETLTRISREGGLSLTLVEMQTIQQHYRDLDRDPTDIELETVAQTWSEHCSHKTLAGRIEYTDENGTLTFNNMLKETIFSATTQLRERWGQDDWCVSVFKDNAGIVTFDDQFHVCFKVETHNRPSAIEPYGGANTGIGGVIRDTLGTGLGAKPICNTDVFCFAPPDTDAASMPEGVLHPARVMRGVVSGVRDYGNRMGIPTVNGAVYFDERYIGNPLVFCGNVGLIPHDKSFKKPRPGDLIVAMGGRTGRDGIHGATFSSAELTDKSEKLDGGAVQIGNAITEKMLMDVLLEARDRGLFSAVTDCGAGGFSSAVGEMGEETGAVVELDQAPLKYAGLSYTEIWISEAQERMVLSVPTEHWEELKTLCDSESVEAVVIGRFTDDQQLVLKYEGQVVGQMAMSFLHDGRPPVVRKAHYQPSAHQVLGTGQRMNWETADKLASGSLLALMGELNIASKHWIIRQYDHEVQGGSVVKPLVGAAGDGPSDAAVVRPRIDSQRAIVVSCGMAPTFGDFDAYHMAASGIDEAIRNCVATGADPAKIAVLDNFCWGYTDRPETLGALVRAALACRDLALAMGVPFVSGKDSLHNEFSYVSAGQKTTISIPHTLLISALGQIGSASKAVTMDLKQAGNLLYQLGPTRCEFGGSHFAKIHGLTGGQVPTVDPERASRRYRQLHQLMGDGKIAACHDLSEGGLSVCLAEMAIAGRLGLEAHLDEIAIETTAAATDSQERGVIPPVLTRLFSESNSRFVIEVAPEHAAAVEATFAGTPIYRLGKVVASPQVTIFQQRRPVLEQSIETLRDRWQSPLDL